MKKILYSLPLFLTASLFAEEAAPANPRSNLIQTLITIGVAILFFYFLLWRPEQKRRKALEQQRSAIKKGDRVTAMGIIGIVVKVQDTTLILRMVDGAKIEMLKGSVTDVQPGTEEDAKKVEA